MNQTENETGVEKDRRELAEATALRQKALGTPTFRKWREELQGDFNGFPEGIGRYNIKFGYTVEPDPEASQPHTLLGRLDAYLQKRKDRKEGIVRCGDHKQYLIPMTGGGRLHAADGIDVYAVSPADAISHFTQTLSEVIDRQYAKCREERGTLPEMAIWARYVQ